jgi:phosphoribosylaminoimidazolecarboxamide formyltransferase/IMP cyclohydrolase
MFKNALVSVADKTGLVEFVKPLADAGMRVVSTGGTAKTLREAGIEVVDVKDQTGYPEVMDGRVKTLHPRIHMCLLGREENPGDQKLLEDESLQLFDLVIGNLYAFEEALSQGHSERELTEFIDIGGPSFLRAAAKNYHQCTTICDPSDYERVAKKQAIELTDRRHLASKVFAHVSTYDSMIAKHLGLEIGQSEFSLGGYFHRSLR